MPVTAFFDGPHNYSNRFDFYEQGGSPLLLKRIIEIIEKNKSEIEEINIGWYLYNNKYFHSFLKGISEEGVKVNVITIPLEGYDNNKPKRLKNLDTGEIQNTKVTKYSLAREIFSEMYKTAQHPNFSLYFFPHLYVRSEFVKKFSRGTLPYSLHLKSAYIKMKYGYIIVLSSSNMATRDLVKHESLICIQNEDHYEEGFKNFYNDLINNSIPIKEYKREFNTSRNTFNFINFKSSSHYFIAAPFYYNSANDLDKSLSDYILKAKERVIICSQHLAAFSYRFKSKYHSKIEEDETRDGVLGSAIKMAKTGLKVTCLSQTFVPPPGQESRFQGSDFRKPANKGNFQRFFAELSLFDNAAYFVNENIHSKFIIIDNTLIYCTYNFTPTQFIYLDDVNIPNFREMPKTSYKGIHCEVSAHVVIEDRSILNLFLDHTQLIKSNKLTIQVL